MAGNVSVPGQAQGTNQPSPPAGVVTATNEVKLVVQANQFKPFPSFRRGTWPTLLDEDMARKVKHFIENFLVSFTGRLKTGAPPRAKFEWIFAPGGQDLEIWIPTDLITDRRPTLANHLDVARFKIVSKSRDLHLVATQGNAIFMEGGEGSPATLKLGGNGAINYVGFKAPTSASGIVWTLPGVDGSNHEVLETNGAGVLDWVAAGGSWDINADLNGPDTISAGMEVEFAGTNGVSTILTETTTDFWKLRIDHDPSGVTPGTYGDGSNVAQIMVDAEGHLTAAQNVAITGGGSGAPTDAEYVVLSLNSSLSAERVLTAGSGITITDGGANSTVTIATTVAEYVGWGVRADASGTGAYVRSNEYVDWVGGDELTTTLVENGTFDGYDLTIDHDSSGVTAGTYGSSTAVGQFTVNEFGHITSASDVAIAGGGGGSFYWIAREPSSGATYTLTTPGTILDMAGGQGIDVTLTTPGAVPRWTAAVDDSVAQHIELTAGSGTVAGSSVVNIDDYSGGTSTVGLVAGSNITLTGGTGAVTIEAASASASDSFGIIAVSGQSDVEADQATDTLTLIAGTNITLTTDASGDSVTIAAAGGGGGGGTLTIEDQDASTGTVEVGTDNLELYGSATHVTGTSGIVSDVNLNRMTFQMGHNICTKAYLVQGSGSVSGDSTVEVGGGTYGGVAGYLQIEAGLGIILTGSDGSGQVNIACEVDSWTGLKTAIVKSRSKNADAFVELYCTESPEVRFEDVITIKPNKRRKLSKKIDPEFVHVCEPDSIKAIGHTTSEPAIAGIKVLDGALEIEFADLLPVPTEIVIHVSGIRAGRAGRRFAKSTKDRAAWNSAFWDLPHQASPGREPQVIARAIDPAPPTKRTPQK